MLHAYIVPDLYTYWGTEDEALAPKGTTKGSLVPRGTDELASAPWGTNLARVLSPRVRGAIFALNMEIGLYLLIPTSTVTNASKTHSFDNTQSRASDLKESIGRITLLSTQHLFFPNFHMHPHLFQATHTHTHTLSPSLSLSHSWMCFCYSFSPSPMTLFPTSALPRQSS